MCVRAKTPSNLETLAEEMQVPVLNSKKPIKQYNMQYKTRNAAPFLTLDNPHPRKPNQL
jgi:hypothetical protein